MFVLTPEDVEVISVQHPKRDKRVPILRYADKNFRLVSVFSAEQQSEAHASWRNLTDNENKACVLLEEPFRYSVWSQVPNRPRIASAYRARRLRQILRFAHSVLI